MLGDPATLIIDSADKVRELRAWASSQRDVDPNGTVAALVNVYHERADTPSREQMLAAQITVQVLATLSKHTVNADQVRAIVSDMMPATAANRIEIVVPDRPAVSLNGPVHASTEIVLRIAALGHPIMMVGPAGCGKTTIGEHVAKALALALYITPAINDAHELLGFIDGHGSYHRTPFRDAFEHGGVWIADEIDSWDASALLTANAALANGFCAFPDNPKPLQRHENFRMIATANTFGSGADRVYVGRNELDAASLDRFATIEVDYDKKLEEKFAGINTAWLHYVWNVRTKVQELRIRHVVSSRAIIMGVRALQAGIKIDDVRKIYLFKGMHESDRKKVQ